MLQEPSVKHSFAQRIRKWRMREDDIKEPNMAAVASNHSKSREYSIAGHDVWEDDDDICDVPANAAEPAIDLVHLARQTLSDQALEVELLDMFERQSARILAQLTEARDADAKIRENLAHTLRGSALSIGAGRVARSAQLYESACAAGLHGGALNATLGALAEAVAEARATIASLLA
jgi:HPt (histidine-containing phosphotransfer) domain-containing protein